MRQLEETSESGDGVSRFTIDPLELQFGHMRVLIAALEHACAPMCALMCMARALHAQEAALGIESFICPTQESKQSMRAGRMEGLPALRREFEANEVILKEGDPMPLLYYVVDGEVEVLFNEGTRVTNVLTPGKNGWLGELWDPNQDPAYWERPHHWMAGFRAKSHSLLVAFDRKALHDVIARSHPLRDAASAAEVSDLWGKLRGCAHASTSRTSVSRSDV